MSSWFFVAPESLDSSPVYLDRENVRHVKALRLKQGDALVLSDGLGRAFYGRLEQLQEDKARVELLGEVKSSPEPNLKVRLFLGITKSDKIDTVVRQCVELGCSQIVPVINERTVVNASAAKWEKKARRWRNIALAAASQSRRSRIPAIAVPHRFQEALLLLEKEELTIVPWEEEKERTLGALLKQYSSPPQATSIVTGPEGGISREEMARLQELSSISTVTLGPRILRAETAPVAVLSVLMGFWGDMA